MTRRVAGRLVPATTLNFAQARGGTGTLVIVRLLLLVALL
jgi:hypothetical protein